VSDLRPRAALRAAETVRHGRLRRFNPWVGALKVLAVGLLVVLVGGLSAGAIVVNNLVSNVKTVDIGNEGEDAPLPTVGAYEGGFNILIVGSDQCEKEGGCEDRDAVLNDVNLLLHVSEDQTNAVAVSIPRDLVIPIPSCTDSGGEATEPRSAVQINQALSIGGVSCVVATVEELTGLTINFAGLITFNGVIAMGDAVGGVPVCIAGPIVDPNTGINITEAGTYTMGGQDALNFLRTRYGVGDGGDLTRISSQQVYLSSLVRTLQSSGTLSDPVKVYRLAQAATQSMTLSTAFAQLDTLASVAFALKDIPTDRVTFVQYPSIAEANGRVLTDEVNADELFDLIQADTPFTLPAAGDGKGSGLDPSATPTPTPTTVPDATATPLPVLDATGQTAADQTCSLPFSGQ
jgi:LCP family protein required for cell wall assembly